MIADDGYKKCSQSLLSHVFGFCLIMSPRLPGDQRRHDTRELQMASLGTYAKEKGVKYFLIVFVDLFGTVRAKIVPATAIDIIAKSGAGFAGFATWLDMTPADGDVLAMPEGNQVIQLPWKPEVAWVPGDLFMDGKEVTQNPRGVLKKM